MRMVSNEYSQKLRKTFAGIKPPVFLVETQSDGSMILWATQLFTFLEDATELFATNMTTSFLLAKEERPQ